uniref:DNA-(apurinic or apyrimidinic site) endonuclease n=1 Tax=Diabrotica virgifera virgifera TaxID=50390 RepID=A0A6P7GTI1_DIAVI
MPGAGPFVYNVFVFMFLSFSKVSSFAFSRIFSFHRSSEAVFLLNRTLFINMPPKRKLAAAATTSSLASGSEGQVKKRGRPAKEEKVEANGKEDKVEENGKVEDEKQNGVRALRARSGRTNKTTTQQASVKPEVNGHIDDDNVTKVSKGRGKKAKGNKEISEATPIKTKRAPRKNATKKEESKKPEKSTKKIKKAAADSSSEADPPKKSKKPRSAKSKEEIVDVEENNDEEPPVKKTKVLLNKTTTDWNSIDFSCSMKNKYDVSYNVIISTWNIGGLKSWASKGCMEYLNHESPDIFCVQETKCNESKLPEEIKNKKLYKQYWCSSEKEGYAGVGIFTVKEPKSVTYGIEDDEQDEDGRCITAEYDTFYLVNVYVPNAGRKLVTLDKRLRWNDSFKNYILKLDEKKPVIICGDMNVSHQEIDLARPKNNTKNAGFTPQERDGMTDFLKAGFIDVYRHMYPEEKDVYSFWTYMSNARSKNIGWRLDYFLVSEKLIKGVCDVKYRTEVLGSDHCPVTLFINA